MRTLIAHKIDSRNFTYTADASGMGGVFSIEMSTLQSLGGIKQVWNDSIDAGFVMVSARTGREAIFVCTEIKLDGERDVVFWKLSPTFSSYNQAGGAQLQHVTVKVFNT
jgi:hypothetical protein